MWFQGVRAVSLTDDVLTLAVPSSLAADRIRSSYTGMLTDTLRDVTGQQLRVELLVETDTRPEEALPSVPPTVGDAPERAPDAGRARRGALPPLGDRGVSTPGTPSTSS